MAVCHIAEGFTERRWLRHINHGLLMQPLDTGLRICTDHSTKPSTHQPKLRRETKTGEGKWSYI